MQRVFSKLLAFCLSLSLGVGLVSPVLGQNSGVQITALDKDGKEIDSLIDGNQVSLQIELPAPVNRDTQVDFLLAGLDAPVAGCRIPSGERDCQSASFPALGWYWNPDGTQQPQQTVVARFDGQQVEAAVLKLSVLPRPLVLVHGFNADFHTWDNYLGPQGYLAGLGLKGFAIGDGQVEGVLNTGSLSDPAARTNSITENATILKEYVDNVQTITGAEKVDLLVHSMGGMISRFYLDRVMTEADVAQLIILGTPMAGSACANLPAALGLLLPATLEIQPSYMNDVFNQQIVHRRGVPFHALAGTKLLDAVQSPCTPVPSDLVVTVDSVKAIPMPVQEIDLLHTELNTSPQVFEEFVTPLLKTPPGQFEMGEDTPARGTPAISQQFTRVFTGHVNPGETQEVVINIDTNVSVANFALYDTSRSLNVSVTGASGNTIQLDAQTNGLIRVEDPSILFYLGYGFHQPRPGRWVVTLLPSAATPTTGADYALMAVFEGGATLTARTDLTVPAINDTVNVNAELTSEGQPVLLQSALATVRNPDGSVETLEMATNGNTAALEIIPDTSGIYGIEVSVTALAPDGMPIDRAAFLSFEAQPVEQQFALARYLAIGALLLVLASIAGIIFAVQKRKKQI
jgi:pimeloyl-ACP methyl ester carboxylesterase